MKLTKSTELLKRAADVLRNEADGILSLLERLDDNFVRAVELMRHCTGKVVVTGVGKSGHICAKIAATLASTGTPAFFLHSGEALHGDLGMVMNGDVILAVSNSGETDEILKLLPHFKHHGLKLIAMTGNPESTLARASEAVLNVGIKDEACPLGLAPTTSTTAPITISMTLPRIACVPITRLVGRRAIPASTARNRRSRGRDGRRAAPSRADDTRAACPSGSAGAAFPSAAQQADGCSADRCGCG